MNKFPKIVFVGKQSVGKTSLLNCIRGKNNNGDGSTIGASYSTLQIPIPNINSFFTIGIWDTAGQERFSKLLPMYYRNADIVIVVYSVDDEDSFTRAQQLIKEISVFINPIFIIIKNKIDLIDDSDNKSTIFPELNGFNWYDLNTSIYKMYTIESLKNLIFREAKIVYDEKINALYKKNIYKVDILNTININNDKEEDKRCCF